MGTEENGTTVKVMSGLAVEVAVNRWLKPQFESETGMRLDIDWRPTTALMKSIAEGGRADVIVAITDSMDRLVADGIVLGDTRAPLADAVLGVGVREGAARPDVSTIEAFKQAMLNARGIAYSEAGASGIYFMSLAERLGIGEDVRKRAVVIPMGFTGEKVASGEADIAIQQISELMTVPGVEVAGPFPDEIQVASQFHAAIFADASNVKGAREFLRILTSPDAAKAYANGGLVSRIAAG
jgi:molybdate transport system substrate-binding protein